MTHLNWLEPGKPWFPPLDAALDEPDGLLAAGGELKPDWLILAYRSGIFPWYEKGQPILWWSPRERCVMYPDRMRISRSLGKRLRSRQYSVRLNTNFELVVRRCSEPRAYARDTWITSEMRAAYLELHRRGYAHSIETYQDDELVGGLYGVSIGRLFFGESMFHLETDASKVAFAYLCRLMAEHHCPMIDCQLENPHLMSLGAEIIPRHTFARTLKLETTSDATPLQWNSFPSNLAPW